MLNQLYISTYSWHVVDSKSLVVGVDLSPVHPVEGSVLLGGLNFTTESAQAQLAEHLEGKGPMSLSTNPSSLQRLNYEALIMLS